MKNNSVIAKWLAYVAIVIAGCVVGGDFGFIAAIALIYMLQN